MDTCRGDVLPLPKDVFVGITAFSGGVQVAFLLASISHISIIRQIQSIVENDGSGSSHTAAKYLVCLISHIISIVVGVGVGWRDHWSETGKLIRAVGETWNILSMAVIVLLSGHPKRWQISGAAAVYATAFFLVHTTVLSGNDVLGVRTAALAAIFAIFAFISTDRRELTSEQLWVSGQLVVLLGFHQALHYLQSGDIIPEEVTTLCYSLLAGWVRYNVTALAGGPQSDQVWAKGVTAKDYHVNPAVDQEVDETLVYEEEGECMIEQQLGGSANSEAATRADSPFGETGESGRNSPLFTSVHKELNKFQLEHRADEAEMFRRMRSDSMDMCEGREANSRRKLLRYVFHEMRAPLNAISMAVELLTNQYKAGGTPKSRKADLETLQMIEEASLTMERTLKDSMTLQRIEEGLLVPQVKIFSVHEMCDDIHDALAQVLRSSSVRFTYSVDSAVPAQLVGDHFRLRHVVAHVVSNAIKYSRPGGEVSMTVGVSQRAGESVVAEGNGEKDKNGGGEHGISWAAQAGPEGEGMYQLSLAARASEDIVFCISDQGVGMSAELQATDIFKPFSQLKTEEIKNFRGSGLGLAICKKIMHFLQGAITYSSVSNEGTTFTVTYPLARLDKESVDECDSDGEEQGVEGHLGSMSGSLQSPLGTPEVGRRKVALSRARSFRGQRLFNIMQTPSSVFECPTPKSTVVSTHSAAEAADVLAEMGVQGWAEHREHHLASIDEVESEDTPQRSPVAAAGGGSVGVTFVDSPVSSPDRPSMADSSPPPPARLSFHSSPRFAAKTLSARTLSMNTVHTSHTSHTAGSYVDRESSYNSPASSFRSDLADFLPKLARSNSSDGEGASETMPRCNSEYAALTEKNVHLHILRSANTDVTRVLQVQGAAGRSRPASIKRVSLADMLSACKVLVVDDALSNRKLLSMLLRRTGFGRVDCVEDGQAAVNYCRELGPEEQPGIIFMDNTMPNLTGIEASKVIRAEGYAHLIIGVTGNSLEDELDEFIAAGADLVIVKPLKNQSLEMLLGFIQANGFDSAHGYRIDQVGKEFTWVPRGSA